MTTNDSTSKVIVSVDVEDWYHGPTAVPQANDPDNSLARFLADNEDVERGHKYIDTCLDLLEKNGIKATFFWVAEYAIRYPALLKSVVNAGHEIACHGLTHCPKLDHTTKRDIFIRTAFMERTARAKKILEDLTGRPVTGYRAPNAYISGTMIDILEELGFKYDSSVSVSSLYNKTNSKLRGVSTIPYFPGKGELNKSTAPRNIVEFPWPFYNFLGFKIPTAGGPLLRFFGSGLIVSGIRQSLRRGNTIYYFHPIDICREDFPFQFSARRPFLWHMKGDLVKRRIEHVLREFAGIAVNFESALKSVRPVTVETTPAALCRR
jgi:peptidoglycan-N-acetylglucosamine deacetylase